MSFPAFRAFDIVSRLGAGGNGEVYLARSRGGQLVAIKVLGESDPSDADRNQAIAREATLSARLNHPAIVKVRGLVEEDGVAALVFEYVPGVALRRLLRWIERREERLPDAAAWYVAERVFAALSWAHAQRDQTGAPAPIVHRDVSPANVLVDWNGEVKLTDFGLAKMIGVSPQTQARAVVGTPGSMSPEQARGDPVDERADVYAAALLAFRLALGTDPYAVFADDPIEQLRAMRNPSLPPLGSVRPDLPQGIVVAIDGALKADPAARTSRAEDVSRAIRSAFSPDAGKDELLRILRGHRAAIEATLPPGRREAPESGKSRRGTLRYEDAVQVDAGPTSGRVLLASPPLRIDVLEADEEPSPETVRTAPIGDVAGPARPASSPSWTRRAPRVDAATEARELPPSPSPHAARRSGAWRVSTERRPNGETGAHAGSTSPETVPPPRRFPSFRSLALGAALGLAVGLLICLFFFRG